MADRSSRSLADLLWMVAFSALALAALLSPADSEGVGSLAVGGHLLWGLAYASAGAGPSRRTEGRGASGLVVGVLAAAGLCEVVGAAVAWREAEDAQALWFVLASAYAAAGIATALRRGPGDGAFACQIFFHLLAAFPVLGACANALLRASAGGSAGGAITGASPLTTVLIQAVQVAAPLLLTALLATLALDLARPRGGGGRDLPWMALMAHQAAFTVITIRWDFQGL